MCCIVYCRRPRIAAVKSTCRAFSRRVSWYVSFTPPLTTLLTVLKEILTRLQLYTSAAYIRKYCRIQELGNATLVR